VRNWWRWALRGFAVLAVAAGGILIVIRPTVTYHPTFLSPKTARDFVQQPIPANLRVSSGCLSPFNEVMGNTLPREGPTDPPFQPSAFPVAACGSATKDSEHIIEALGIGVVVLVGLSFLPRRRAPAIKQRLEPSPV